MLDPGPAQLPHGEAGPLEQRPGLVGEDAERDAPLVGGEDHGQRRAVVGRRQAAGVAVREELCAVRAHPRARLVLLRVDRLGLGAGGAGQPGGGHGECRVPDPVHRPAEIGGRGARAAQPRPAVLERLLGRMLGDLHGEGVGGGDADERRAADAQPADRRGGVVGAGERDDPLLERQPRLVEDPEAAAVPGQWRLLGPRGRFLALGRAHAAKVRLAACASASFPRTPSNGSWRGSS